MIVTVTMNPAVDKTVEIERLLPGGLNRIRKVEYDAGGKGINVSKTIQKFGGSSVATGFLGGNTGKTIENVLKNQKISCDFVWVDGAGLTAHAVPSAFAKYYAEAQRQLESLEQ